MTRGRRVCLAEDPGHDLEVGRGGQHADLDAADIEPSRERLELAGDGPGRHGEDAAHPLRALGGHRREDAETPPAEALENPQVEEDAGAGRRVPAGDGDQVFRHSCPSAADARILPRIGAVGMLTLFRALEY